jgi:hypothetical protein
MVNLQVARYSLPVRGATRLASDFLHAVRVQTGRTYRERGSKDNTKRLSKDTARTDAMQMHFNRISSVFYTPLT